MLRSINILYLQKPLIGFEPMTYALPWRYSTTELKGQKRKKHSIHDVYHVVTLPACQCLISL